MSVPHRVPQQVMPATSKAPHRLPFPVKAFPDPIKKSHSHLQDSITVAIGARAPAITARPVSAPVVLGSQHVARHAESGLGPSPGVGPVRVGAHMGPYGLDFD